MRSFMFLPFFMSTLLMLFLVFILEGCCGNSRHPSCMDGTGGGQDSVTIDLPFDGDYSAQCVQGAGGSYSHQYTSTQYDADLDTPNDTRDPVYAPVSGIARVHDNSRTTGFGVHLNIDMQDGTYIVLGHLDDIFVDDGSEVAAGQLVAFEGTTGASTGDHVHIGRHDGDAGEDAGDGESIEGLAIHALDATTGVTADVMTSDMTCSLSGGHRYTSLLSTPRWHPDGTLVKTPDVSTVYVLDNGNARAFVNEESFWSQGYDFDDVALISGEELACYGAGLDISDEESEASSMAHDDFQDGNLVSEFGSSTVYVMSNGIAMPIETWDTYLLMGFGGRAVTEVADGAVDANVAAVGDCGANAYCVSRSDVVTCGGPSVDDEGSYPEHEDTGATADTTEASTDTLSGTTTDTTSSADGLSVTWTTPSGAVADRITLSGEYTHSGGWSEGWQTLASVSSLASLTYEVLDATQGDALRFSAEFVQNGATSWSCLAPYPPGVVQGTPAASYRGSTLSINTADDPGSDGCGLLVTVP